MFINDYQLVTNFVHKEIYKTFLEVVVYFNFQEEVLPRRKWNQGYLDKDIPYWTHPRQFSRFTISYDGISTIINWLSVNFVH